MRNLVDWYRKFRILPKWLQTLIFILSLGVIWGISLLINPNSGLSGSGEYAESTTGMMISALLKLVIVLALIYVAGIALSRWKGFSPVKSNRKMNVVETLHLSPRRSLHLIKVGNKYFLIGATDQAVALVSEIGIVDENQNFDLEKNRQSSTFTQIMTGISSENASSKIFNHS